MVVCYLGLPVRAGLPVREAETRLLQACVATAMRLLAFTVDDKESKLAKWPARGRDVVRPRKNPCPGRLRGQPPTVRSGPGSKS